MPTHKDQPFTDRHASSRLRDNAGRDRGSAEFVRGKEPLDVDEVPPTDKKSNDGGAAGAKPKTDDTKKSAVKNDGKRPSRLARTKTAAGNAKKWLAKDATKAMLKTGGKRLALAGTGLGTATLALDAFDWLRSSGEILHHAPEYPRTQYLPVANNGHVDNPHDNGNSVEDLDAVIADTNKASFGFAPESICAYCDEGCSGGCGSGVTVSATQLDPEVLSAGLTEWMNRAVEVPNLFADMSGDTWTERMNSVYTETVDLQGLQEKTATVSNALNEAVSSSNNAFDSTFNALRATVMAGREEMNRRVQHDNNSLAWVTDAVTSNQGEGSVDRLREARSKMERAEAENDEAVKDLNAAVTEWTLTIGGQPVTPSDHVPNRTVRAGEPKPEDTPGNTDPFPDAPVPDDTTPEALTPDEPAVPETPMTDPLGGVPGSDVGSGGMPGMPDVGSGGMPGDPLGSMGAMPAEDTAVGDPFADVADEVPEDEELDDALDDELDGDEDEDDLDDETLDDEDLDDEDLDDEDTTDKTDELEAPLDAGAIAPVAEAAPLGDNSDDVAARTVTLEDGRSVTMPNAKLAEMVRQMMASESTSPMTVPAAMAAAGIPMEDSGALGSAVPMSIIQPGDVVTDSTGANGVYIGNDEVLMENHEITKLGDLDLVGTDAGVFHPESEPPATTEVPADPVDKLLSGNDTSDADSIPPLETDAAVSETDTADGTVSPLGDGVDLVS